MPFLAIFGIVIGVVAVVVAVCCVIDAQSSTTPPSRTRTRAAHAHAATAPTPAPAPSEPIPAEPAPSPSATSTATDVNAAARLAPDKTATHRQMHQRKTSGELQSRHLRLPNFDTSKIVEGNADGPLSPLSTAITSWNGTSKATSDGDTTPTETSSFTSSIFSNASSTLSMASLQTSLESLRGASASDREKHVGDWRAQLSREHPDGGAVDA